MADQSMLSSPQPAHGTPARETIILTYPIIWCNALSRQEWEAQIDLFLPRLEGPELDRIDIGDFMGRIDGDVGIGLPLLLDLGLGAGRGVLDLLLLAFLIILQD